MACRAGILQILSLNILKQDTNRAKMLDRMGTG